MDIRTTTQPKSDQQNYDDYIAGPRIVTVERVEMFDGDQQPVHVHLVEFPGRPYKPSKNMRRVLNVGWGYEMDNYTGRRLELKGDPNTKYGGIKVGGIKISGMSDLDKPLVIALTETRGKKAPHEVRPLPDAPPPAPTVTAEQIAACTDQNELREWWGSANAETREVIQARVAELKASEA